jgi:predicted hotdog family 3-hydroxylacyl-ACP dehydratase
MLSRAQIEALVPHAGSMCLLDRVLQWDETRIVCHAAAPESGHPLATTQGVPVIAAVEYAAQATALHGALLDGRRKARNGMLAKLADVELFAQWLDESSGALDIQAELLVRGTSGCTYSFMVQDASGCRARGRLLVAFTNDD